MPSPRSGRSAGVVDVGGLAGEAEADEAEGAGAGAGAEDGGGGLAGDEAVGVVGGEQAALGEVVGDASAS